MAAYQYVYSDQTSAGPPAKVESWLALMWNPQEDE
jgi:hypothetical protein